jgi:membrane protease YdiL (CAAX protease family)
MKREAWVQRHPLIAYFLLAYGISWGGILVVLGLTGFDLAHLRPLDTGIIFVLMLLGPSIGGLAMTARLERRDGLRQLGKRLTLWRVDRRWYAFALLTVPVLLLAVLLPLGILVDPAYAPRFQWTLFAIGLVAGSFEEIGWTGFATPRLLARARPFMAGLLLGLLWALWHLLVDFRQNFHALGAAWLLEFVVLYVAALTAYRLLMTWVYANPQSLLLAVLMHASYTGWLLVLYPATSFAQGLVWQSAFAVTLWAAVAVVYSSFATRRSRPSTQSTRATTPHAG